MTEQTTPETGARRPTVADVLAQDAGRTAHLTGSSRLGAPGTGGAS